jgi:hypothetical protein
MLRAILSVIAGVVTWMVIATAGNLALRLAWPGYAQAEPTMAFTLPMLLARLALGAVASIGAGYVGAWISRGSRAAVGVLAAILLIFFLPVHYRLWDTFPSWYHATFLISLLVLTLAGGTLRGLGVRRLRTSAADRPAGP